MQIGGKMAINKTTELIPSADRLITSLRDVGYDFPTAIADIIDNSIDAGSTEIRINFEFAGADSWVTITDNGIGMNSEELEEAMRFGSKGYKYKNDGLGKFGLGLKTASISQCNKLTVISSAGQNPKQKRALCWDLEHVKLTNKWEVIEINQDEINQLLNLDVNFPHGTTVIWQGLDRVIDINDPLGEYSKNRCLNLCRLLEDHISMVFHRFLSSEVPAKNLQIYLNGNMINPWDPFVRKEEYSRKLSPVKLKLVQFDYSGIVTIQPYVLPAQSDFSCKEAFNKASGPKKWNRQQGFYIYRADRMIQSGGWSGIRTLDEHSKLARIALDFSPSLDEGFKINVSKMKVELPSQISKQIEDALKPVLKIADEVYRKESKNKKPPLAGHPPSTTTPPGGITTGGQKPAGITGGGQSDPSIVERKYTLTEIEKLLVDQANMVEAGVIESLFKRIRTRNIA